MGINGIGAGYPIAGYTPKRTQQNTMRNRFANQVNNVATTKGTKNVNSIQELSEAEGMELFKKEFYEDLSKVTIHKTLNNVAINISEAGFKAMKDNPEYREKILSLLQRDLESSLAPRNCSAVFTVGATLNEYRGDSWPIGYDSEFNVRSQNSFYKRTNEKKDRQKELLEEYLEKRAWMKEFQQESLDEKVAKMELERSRLFQSWNSEGQMAKASKSAYEANIMQMQFYAGNLKDYLNYKQFRNSMDK